MQGKSRKDRQKKSWGDNINAWKGIDFASSTRAAEDRTRWKGTVVKSYLMLNDLSRLCNRLD